MILFVDELISQIHANSVSKEFLYKSLESMTVNDDTADRDIFVHEVMSAISSLLGEVAACVTAKKWSDAHATAQHLRDIILTVQKVSKSASEEGLSPICHSQVVRVGTVEGKPIYALK